jgi:hypothetical protein
VLVELKRRNEKGTREDTRSERVEKVILDYHTYICFLSMMVKWVQFWVTFGQC